MHNIHRKAAILTAVLIAVLLQACSRSSSTTSPDHIRGTIEKMDGQVLTVATPSGTVRVQLAQPTQVATVVRSDRQQIKAGSFLGITSVPQADGSQRAVEIHVFPEAMRGSGEGSYAWDLPGSDTSGSQPIDRKATPSRMTNGTVAGSRMTNGTVSSSTMTEGTVTGQHGGSSLTLNYKDGASTGSQTIAIPPDIPIVAIEPGQPADLQAGAHIFVVAHRDSGGTLTADRVMVGRNGVVPPM